MTGLKRKVLTGVFSAFMAICIFCAPVCSAGMVQAEETTEAAPVAKPKPKPKGEQVVAYAKKYLGRPYRYGGTSLTKGTDCSGFTMRIFQHFGKKIPRTSRAQRKAGKKVKSLKQAKPGDLICYSGHVAIYMGKNKIIHASNRKTGIKISKNARYKKIVAIRRIVK